MVGEKFNKYKYEIQTTKPQIGLRTFYLQRHHTNELHTNKNKLPKLKRLSSASLQFVVNLM
jgi:hypothetical protein